MRSLSPPKNRFLRGIYLMGRRYLHHSVAIQGAALAFYLLFTIFPLLIFISALLGLLELDVAAIIRGLEALLPKEVLDLVEMYLTHVSANRSPQLLLFGLFFSIYFPMRATSALMHAVRTAYHLGPPKAMAVHWLKTLLYTALLIVTISLTLVLMTVGDRVLYFAVEHFHLPAFAAQTCARLLFPLAALAQDARQPWRNIWPGTLAALAAWMGISWLYALYVDNFANYSVLYGSIGTLIVLLIWLNLTAVTLILGAELNGVLISLRKDSQHLDGSEEKF